MSVSIFGLENAIPASPQTCLQAAFKQTDLRCTACLDTVMVDGSGTADSAAMTIVLC